MTKPSQIDFHEIPLVEHPIIEVCESLDETEDVVDFARTRLAGEKTEQFLVIYLDNGNHLLDTKVQEEGTVDQLKLYPRKVVERALKVNCSRIIVIHNHPSGVVEPSPQDEKLTRTLKDAVKPLNISLMDHIIVTETSYYSFSNNNICGF